MFVKIENYLGNGDLLVLNIDNLVSIEASGNQEKPYKAIMCSGKEFPLTEQQHTELCKVLTKGV